MKPCYIIQTTSGKKTSKKQNKVTRPKGPVRSGSVSLVTAPASVSTNGLRRGLDMSGYRDRDGQPVMVISGIVPYLSLGAASSTGAGFIDRIGNRTATHNVSPMDSSCLCPQLAQIAHCFSKYRFRRLGFVYDPMGSTASAVRLALAYTSDPLNYVMANQTGPSGYTGLLTMATCKVFSPWMGPWSLACSVDDTWKYNKLMSSPDNADKRMEFIGTVGCCADSDPVSDYSYGILSMSFVLELKDLTYAGTMSTASVSLASSAVEQKEIPTSEVTLNDVVVVDHPNVSTVPPLAGKSSNSLTQYAPTGMSARRV